MRTGKAEESAFVGVSQDRMRALKGEPARLVGLVIVVCGVAAEIAHEEESHRLASPATIDRERVRDRHERRDDRRFAAGLFAHLAQRGDLFGLVEFDMPFGEGPDARLVTPNQKKLVPGVCTTENEPSGREFVDDATHALSILAIARGNRVLGLLVT